VSKNPSRWERFEVAMSDVSDAKTMVEELRNELQSWRDNLPENLQDGEKASQLDEAIQSLETVIEGLDQAESESPEFPSMF
jgi:ATP-dependent protease HslVU (ClpYQ) peptidase subunit